MAEQKAKSDAGSAPRSRGLSDERKKELADALSARGVRADCPMCGQRKWTLLDAYLNHNLQAELTGALVIGGPSVPSLAIVCGNCGFLSQHALGALGLLGQDRGE